MATNNDIIDEILFNGGLDTDSDEKFVKQGDYVDALNIGKFYGGEGGIVSNAKGNSELTNAYLPVGTNKCIGWCSDDENNALIFFNYNSNNNHGIYRYLKDDGSFQKILHNESVLAFSSDTVNLQADVVGDMLYWNEGKDINGDYINVPRKINIEKARRHTNSLGGDAYSDITEDTISAIKKSTISNIYASLLEDTGFSYNFLKASIYQFAFELVYDDNEKSVLSNRTNFVYTNEGGSENYIAIRFNYDDVGDTLSKINVYYKDSILSDFKLGGVIDVNSPENIYFDNNTSGWGSALVDGATYWYRFYGNSNSYTYTGSSGKLFDSVPIYANSQVYTDNRMMYGGAKLSYDKSDIDVTFETFSIPGGTLGITANVYSGTGTEGFYIDNLDSIIYGLLNSASEYFTNVRIYVRQVINQSAGDVTEIRMVDSNYSFAPTMTQSDIQAAILANWDFTYYTTLGGPYTNTSVEWQSIGAGQYRLVVYRATTDVSLSIDVLYEDYHIDRVDDTYLLPGSYYQFCVYLFDDYFRTTGAITSDKMKLYIPARATLATASLTWGIEWTINEILPVWVRYVSFGYSRCLDFDFVWQIQTPTWGSGDKSFLIPTGYTFTDGDVLRILGSDTVYSIDSGDDTKIYMDSSFSYSSGSIEILRPKTIADSGVFYELSMLYENDYVHGYVIGDISQNNGYFVGGDFNYIEIDATNSYLSHNNSDDMLFYSSRRVIPELDDYGDIEYQSIYFSQKYFDNTKINGLSSFDFANKADLSDINGDIIDLQRVGEVLYAIQRREITSFYLGKAILKQSSTGEVTADTSQILAGKRESAFDYGSIFKTERLDNYIFGYDIYKGVFWMNSYNGVQPISGKAGSFNYKMDKYFKDKSKALLASGIENIDVKIGIDKPNETIYVTFTDLDESDNNETIAYHLPSNRWISRYSFIPELYAWLDDEFYSLKIGKLYLQNDDNANRCTFYGSAYSSFIQLVSHALPQNVKVFNAIGIHSTKQYTVDPIEMPANSTYKNGMYSKILDTQFELVEGVYRSEFNRNMKTNQATASNYDLWEGDQLRGNVIKLKLTNSDIVKSELFKVDITSEISK